MSDKPKRVRKTRTVVEHEVRILPKHLRKIVKECFGVDIPRGDCAFYVQVPGGADWSNTDLDIDSETPVIVSWTERFQSEEDVTDAE